MARAQELVRQVRDLGRRRVALGVQLVPVVVPARDEARVVVDEARQVLGLGGVRGQGVDVAVEARVAHVDHGLGGQDARVGDAGGRRLAEPGPGRGGRRVQAEAVVLVPLVQVEGAHHLVVRAQLPRELPEVSVLDVAHPEQLVGAGDADVEERVALALEGGEEPELVLDHRPADLRGEVRVLVALPGAARVRIVGARVQEGPVGVPDAAGVVRGEPVALPEEVGVAVELVRALAGDDVVDRSRQVPVLGRRPEGEHLDLVDGVDVGLGQRLVEVVVGDVDAVHLEGVLVVRGAVHHGAPAPVAAAFAALQGARRLRDEVEEAVA